MGGTPEFDLQHLITKMQISYLKKRNFESMKLLPACTSA
jgi:hypothetical protein